MDTFYTVLTYYFQKQKFNPEVFCQNIVLKIFGNFTRKQLWQSPIVVTLLIKVLQIH